MSHLLHSFDFRSFASDSWERSPNPEALKRQIALSVLAHSELTEVTLGLRAPPEEIKEVRLTVAAYDQIAAMWHGHRAQGQMSPPAIPLKIFVFGFGQDATGTWASIEVLPGLDNWAVD